MTHLTSWVMAIVLIALLAWVTLHWFRHEAGKHKSKHPHAMEALSRNPSQRKDLHP